MAATLRSTSLSRVDQLLTLMRIAVRPCHTVMPHQQVPSRLQGRHYAARALGVAETHEHLIEYHLVEHRVARGCEPRGELARLRTVALHELGQPKRPRLCSAAQTSTPRARRDSSGV